MEKSFSVHTNVFQVNMSCVWVLVLIFVDLQKAKFVDKMSVTLMQLLLIRIRAMQNCKVWTKCFLGPFFVFDLDVYFFQDCSAKLFRGQSVSAAGDRTLEKRQRLSGSCSALSVGSKQRKLGVLRKQMQRERKKEKREFAKEAICSKRKSFANENCKWERLLTIARRKWRREWKMTTAPRPTLPRKTPRCWSCFPSTTLLGSCAWRRDTTPRTCSPNTISSCEKKEEEKKNERKRKLPDVKGRGKKHDCSLKEKKNKNSFVDPRHHTRKPFRSGKIPTQQRQSLKTRAKSEKANKEQKHSFTHAKITSVV